MPPAGEARSGGAGRPGWEHRARPRERPRAQSVQVQTRSRFPRGLGVAVQQVRVSEVMGKSGLTGDGRATLYVRATELSQVVEVVSLGCF